MSSRQVLQGRLTQSSYFLMLPPGHLSNYLAKMEVDNPVLRISEMLLRHVIRSNIISLPILYGHENDVMIGVKRREQPHLPTRTNIHSSIKKKATFSISVFVP